MPQSQQPLEGERRIVEDIRELAGRPTVLDVGAGDGKWGRALKGLPIDAVEAHKPSADSLARSGLYRNVYREDIRLLKVFSGGARYDVVILGDVLEHMPEPDAQMLVAGLKQCVGRIYLTIPITDCPQDGTLIGNPWETHHYQWSDKEIRAMGFRLLHAGGNENGMVGIGTYWWEA